MSETAVNRVQKQSEYCMVEIFAVESFTKDGLLIVASCCKPPTNNEIDRIDWITFFAQFEGLLVIGGDFNPAILSGVAERIVETSGRSLRALACVTLSYSMTDQPPTTVQLVTQTPLST
jgi:hypothetical protein